MLHYQLLGRPLRNEIVFLIWHLQKDMMWFDQGCRRPWNKIKFHLESIYCFKILPPLWFHWKNKIRVISIISDLKLYSTIINLNDNSTIVHWFCKVVIVLILKWISFLRFEWKSRGSTITFILYYCFDIPWEDWKTISSTSTKIVVMVVQLVLHYVQ